MLLWGLLIQLFITPSFAQSLDDKLQKYIVDFQLKPLEKNVVKNKALFDLGRKLFFDKNISGNKNINCAECHHPAVMTHDGLPLALGEGAVGIEAHGGRRQVNGKLLARNSPALFNLTNDMPFMFWDGRVAQLSDGKFSTPAPLNANVARTIKSTIAAQAIFPMVDHAEMRGAKGSNPIADAETEEEAWSLIVKRIESNEVYRVAFNDLFPGEQINIGHLAEAIAEFEREAFFFANTAYDRYLKGNLTAMTQVQKIGMDVFFNKGRCGECHRGEHLTNFEFHNIAIPQIGPGKSDRDDLGRFNVTGDQKDLYAFRVPALRNVGLTAPYMHNGSFKTLAQVIEHYDRPEFSLRGYALVNNWKNYIESILGHDHRTDNDRIAALSPKLNKELEFLEEEEKALAEFIRGALTDKRFLDQEITSDYLTYMRFQLRSSGFKKLLAQTAALSKKSTNLYYYFDLMLEGGFALRELEEPIRLMIIHNNKGSTLLFRKELYKQADAQNDIVLDGRFNLTEYAPISEDVAASIINPYEDMFQRMYTYIRPERQDEIPSTELSIIKNDLEAINTHFKEIDFKNMIEISDLMNRSVKDLFFVPTSFNNKETFTRDILVNNTPVRVALQSSIVRTETGGQEETWAIEFETSKVLKKDLKTLSKAIFNYLNEAGINASDIGGGSPAPSLATERVINQIFQ